MRSERTTLELDTTVEEMVDRLPADAKLQLVRRLERETLSKRIDNLFKKIDQRRKKYPISQKEIAAEIKAVREQIYGKSSN